MDKICGKCGNKISAVGGRRFCKNCEKDAKKTLSKYTYVDRNIMRRRNSYVVRVFAGGKPVYIKATTNLKTAIELRDLAESKIKSGEFGDWYTDFVEMEGDCKMYVGEKIRKEKGMSRKELSDKSGVPYRTIDNWEKRVNKLETVAILKKVADALECKIDDLWEDEEEAGCFFVKIDGVRIEFDTPEVMCEWLDKYMEGQEVTIRKGRDLVLFGTWSKGTIVGKSYVIL